MVFKNHLVQRKAAGARDRHEIAMRQLGTLRCPRGTGGVHDGGQIVGTNRLDTRIQLLVGHGDAQALQCAHGIGVEHQNMLQRRAVVDDGVETVEALAIVRDGQLHVGIVENTLGLRRGIGVVDRHIDRADRGQREIKHAPLVTGGGEEGDGVALGDAERDQAFGRGEHVLVEFAGRHLGPLARSGFAFRDHGVFAGALDAFGKQGVDGFVVAYFDGCARGRVLGEHEVFSFLAFPRFSWVLRYMRSLRLR